MRNTIVYRIKKVREKWNGFVIPGNLLDLPHFVSQTKTKFWFFLFSIFKIHHQMGQTKTDPPQNSIGFQLELLSTNSEIVISMSW